MVLGTLKVLAGRLAMVSSSAFLGSAPSTGGVVGIEVETGAVTGVGIEVATGLGDWGNTSCLVDVVCICGASGAVEGGHMEGGECAEAGLVSGPPFCFVRLLHPKTPAAPNTPGVLVVSVGTWLGVTFGWNVSRVGIIEQVW